MIQQFVEAPRHREKQEHRRQVVAMLEDELQTDDARFDQMVYEKKQEGKRQQRLPSDEENRKSNQAADKSDAKQRCPGMEERCGYNDVMFDREPRGNRLKDLTEVKKNHPWLGH